MGMDTERAAAIIDIKERALAVDRRYVLYPARLKIGWRIQKLWDREIDFTRIERNPKFL